MTAIVPNSQASFGIRPAFTELCEIHEGTFDIGSIWRNEETEGLESILSVFDALPYRTSPCE